MEIQSSVIQITKITGFFLNNDTSQVTHKNRQRRMARIIADMSREPEPYLVPKLQQQRQLDKLPVSAVAAVAASSTRASGFGKDVLGDQVLPKAGSRYADLGGVEPISLISFAYQIATGMVRFVWICGILQMPLLACFVIGISDQYRYRPSRPGL